MYKNNSTLLWCNPTINNRFFFIYHIHIPSLQHQLYTEWDIRSDFERRIMVKSAYIEFLDEFGVPKITLWYTLNALFPPHKCSSLKHLGDLISVSKVMRQRFREVIFLATIKNTIGRPTNFLRDKEAYIVTTEEIKGAQVLPKYTISLKKDLKKVLHFIGK